MFAKIFLQEIVHCVAPCELNTDRGIQRESSCAAQLAAILSHLKFSATTLLQTCGVGLWLLDTVLMTTGAPTGNLCIFLQLEIYKKICTFSIGAFCVLKESGVRYGVTSLSGCYFFNPKMHKVFKNIPMKELVSWCCH